MLNKKISLIIWIVAICTVLTAAYVFYSKNKQQGLVISPPQNNTTTESDKTDNKSVPDFSLKDLDGNTVRLSDYKGKIVILNFWTVWCKYCKIEMPDLNELNKELEKDGEAVILAVDVQESADKVKDYISSNNIDLKVLMDHDGSVTQKYGVSGFPTTFIINKDGTLYTYIPGATDKKTLTEILNKIKQEASAQ